MSNEIDSIELSKRMISRLAESASLDVWFYHLIDQHLAKHCGSPIEAMLGAAMLFQDKLDGVSTMGLCLAAQAEIPHWPKPSRLLIPQYRFEDYRIDWVLLDAAFLTFIECDGHDFHERTKMQAQRDKERDRKIQAAGHPILRFTGSEIFNDPFQCATQILEFADLRHLPAHLRERA